MNDDAVAVVVHITRRIGRCRSGKKAEQLIAETKPSAYQKAAKYLQKAARVMKDGKKSAEWERYVNQLREKHIRKRRLIEILDGLEGKRIISKPR